MTVRDVTIATDASLVAREEADAALRMDEEAFRGFYDRTSRALWVYLRHLTGSRDAADELLQESYFRFLRAKAPLETEAHRRHYLFRIATNLARDGFRRGRSRPQPVTAGERTDATERSAVERPLETRIDLTYALGKLSHRERALLWFAYAEGNSHKEIAALVGVRAGSVKALLYRARRRLAKLLERDGSRS